MNEFAGPFQAMISRLFTPAKLREIDRGNGWETEQTEIAKSGFLDVLLSEDEGGAGLGVGSVIPLWFLIGRAGAPLAVGSAMIERAAGGAADRANAHAVLVAAAMAGAADRVLTIAIQYANERVQFGKPVARQQAVQQNLAVMAEYVVAMRLASELAGNGRDWPTATQAAFAKTVSALYGPPVANGAHAVLGAIGISAEHDLQLFTKRIHSWRIESGSESIWSRRLGRALLASPQGPIDWVRCELFS
jgi:alkylation response protein AidB-like acyl-CoA dehydrogenase